MKNPSASNPEDDFHVPQTVLPPAAPKQPKAPASTPAQSLREFAPIGLPKPNLPRVRLKQTHDDDEGVDIKVPDVPELLEKNLPTDYSALSKLKKKHEASLPDSTRKQKLIKDKLLAPLRRKWFEANQVAPPIAIPPLRDNRRHERLVAKLRNAIVLLVGIAVTALVSPQAAHAQAARDYVLLNGGTNNLAAGATNTAVIQSVVEWNQLSLQATARGQSGTASNAQFYVYRSLDAENYETDPVTVLQLRLNGTTTQSAFTNIDSTGASSIKIVPANTNAAAITNLLLKARFKLAK